MPTSRDMNGSVLAIGIGVVITLSALMSSCTDDQPRKADSTRSARGAQSTQESSLLSNMTDSAAPSLSLGAMDTPPEQVFGEISDVESDSAGRIYVLDSQGGAVRIFGPSGAFLTEIGRFGDGPGEFAAPSSLAILDDGSLVVAGTMGRVTRFLRDDSDLPKEFDRSFSVPLGVMSMCGLDNRLYLEGVALADSFAIHSFDTSGRFRNSFAPLFEAEDPMVRETFSWGWVACEKEERVIAYAPRYAGTVALFRPDGRKVWTVSIPEFRPIPFEVRPDANNLVAFSWVTPEGTDRVVSLEVQGEQVIVQVATRDVTSTSRYDFQRLRTMIFQIASGRLMGVREDLPVVRGLGSRAIYATAQEPFPRVTLYPLENLESTHGE